MPTNPVEEARAKLAKPNYGMGRRNRELMTALCDEVERLRQQQERDSTCIVCDATLLVETSEPPHCIDCHPTDERREEWEHHA